MIIAVCYRFHDNESKTFAIDTNLLDVNHLFESDFKDALEGFSKFVQMDGEKYEDDWGNIDKAKVNIFPMLIDAIKEIHIFWDC
jgi:hypothetical protein